MGRVQPDTGRNVFGLRHTVSILIDTRGVGLGRAHFSRRVRSHVVVSLAVIRAAALQGESLVKAVADVGMATAALACRGDVVVRAQATPTKEHLQFVNAISGSDRTVLVKWRSALALKVVTMRAERHVGPRDRHVCTREQHKRPSEVPLHRPAGGGRG